MSIVDEADAFPKEPTPPESLLRAQALLAEAIRRPLPLALDADTAAVSALARGSRTLSPIEQVDVYREQFWLRHIASLKEDFPTLVQLLGGRLPRARERYLERFPPSHHDLRFLSEDMERFVASELPYSNDPLLAECARIEWAFIDAYHAADPTPFDATPLATAAPDAVLLARFELQAPLRLVVTRFATHDFREAVRAEGRAPEVPRPAEREVHLAIFRVGDALRSYELEPASHAVLAALKEGLPLGQACERALAMGLTEEDVSQKLAAWFAWWTQWGLLAKVVLPGAPPS
ncbi:MAG: putative DNA-binding domain-containing protein [Myxococcales bacterium]|nr:putative DNA-binding domain-containing protein [Myxococcales bacterium]